MMRVMVVEDEEMIRRGIVMAVDWAALDCVVVGEAANGEQALAVAEDCRPTLIITDLKMPKMDGLEMVRRLREAGSRAYVIILTAYDSFAYAQQAIRLGAVDFLLKPFHDGDLENAVLALQKRIAAQAAPQPEPLPGVKAGSSAAGPQRRASEPSVQEGNGYDARRISHALPHPEGYGAAARGKAEGLRGRGGLRLPRYRVFFGYL